MVGVAAPIVARILEGAGQSFRVPDTLRLAEGFVEGDAGRPVNIKGLIEPVQVFEGRNGASADPLAGGPPNLAARLLARPSVPGEGPVPIPIFPGDSQAHSHPIPMRCGDWNQAQRR
jgi:hypothetical protein